MRAVVITRLDGPGSVEVADVPDAAPGDGEVLIEVRAAGVTFPDVLQTRGLYQYEPDLPFVPGSEVGGVVRSAPPGSGFTPGQRVAAFCTTGGYAELVRCPPELVFAVPDRVSFAEAAGLPMNYLTAHFALVRRGRLAPGRSVLVHGAGGGVGTASVQLAAALGARVIAVVSSDAKEEVARAAGATDVVRADGFLAAVKELTGGVGVDLVVDPVGGDRFTDSLRSLAPEGSLLVVGFTGGEIPTVRVNRLLLNNIAVVGVGWGAFALPRPGYPSEQWSQLAPLVASGALRPQIAASYPLDAAGTALAALENRTATGKLVLTVPG